MLVFAKRMLLDKYKSLVAYSLAAIAFLEMYVVLFPVVHERSGQFDQVLKTFPPEIFKAMNIDPSSLSFASLQSYLSSEYMSFLWPILAIIFAVSLANYIIVGEVDKGTIETLASLPASRRRVFIERYLAGILMLAVFCFATLFSAIPLAILHSTDYVLANYFTTAVGSFLFIWAVFSLATLFSAIFSEKGKASMASGAVLILMYVLNIIANLNHDLQDLRYFSAFNYFRGSDLIANNIYPEYAFVALGGFAIVATIVALGWFEKRDLSV